MIETIWIYILAASIWITGAVCALILEKRTVKPLDWDGKQYDWSWWAKTPFGELYRIREYNEKYFLDYEDVTITSGFETLELAKSAAQVDFEKRVQTCFN